MQKLLYQAVLGVCALAVVPARAQQAAGRADSLAVATAVLAASQQYDRAARPESLLFNGPEYVNYVKPGTIGHQFFMSAEPRLGTVNYRNATFRDVPLSYDLARDQVVMTYPGQATTITLVPDKLTAFTLGEHQFVHLVADSAGRLPTGFYEVLLAGPVSLLAHHSKRVQQQIIQQVLNFEFKQTDQLYVRTASKLVEISSLNDLLALLPAHQSEVQRYARQQQLRFSAAQRAASALSALRYYYTLAR